MSIQRALELAYQIYWANEQPKLGRPIDNLLIVLGKLDVDRNLDDRIGMDNPLDGTRLWDNSDD